MLEKYEICPLCNENNLDNFNYDFQQCKTCGYGLKKLPFSYKLNLMVKHIRTIVIYTSPDELRLIADELERQNKLENVGNFISSVEKVIDNKNILVFKNNFIP